MLTYIILLIALIGVFKVLWMAMETDIDLKVRAPRAIINLEARSR